MEKKRREEKLGEDRLPDPAPVIMAVLPASDSAMSWVARWQDWGVRVEWEQGAPGAPGAPEAIPHDYDYSRVARWTGYWRWKRGKKSC